MALMKCPECGKEISDKTEVCIHCGYPLSSSVTMNNKFYVNIDGRNYDMTELKEMYRAYNSEDQELIYQYCKSTFKTHPVSYNYQDLKDCEYRGLDLIQYVKETLKWPDVKAYLTYKFIAKCYKKNFESFSFKTDKYKFEQYNQLTPQPSISQNVVRCPKCGSTSVTTEEKGYGLFGWIGASQKKNLCQKCGHKWWPGR